MKISMVAALAAAAVCGSAMAGATFGVDGITNNSVFSTNVGEAQLTIDVSGGPGTVVFLLQNSGPDACSVANVYFDDIGLLGSAVIGNGSGVNFEAGGSPPDLPGGSGIGFITDQVFSARNPKPTNGVNAGESLTLTFALLGGSSVADVVSAMNSGSLRVGMHVISFANGESEGFVTPTPGSLALLGLGGLAAFRRRR
jgi:uncharacterized protein (TIGR03382 family)